MENFITLTSREYLDSSDIPSVNSYAMEDDEYNCRAIAEEKFGIVLVDQVLDDTKILYEVYFDSPESMTKYVMSR